MKESVSTFESRTGLAYRPPRALLALGRPVRACPTLFRYPGPFGVHEHLGASLTRLAPAQVPWVWLASRALGSGGRSAARFGTLAVLEPLRLSPCAVEPKGCWLGVNRLLAASDALVWVPPAAVAAPVPWGSVRTESDALERFGPGYASERARVAEELSAYVEELSLLRGSGAAAPPVPWCEVPGRERSRILASLGITPRWTAAHP
jgi:hypothetical protein